MSVIKPFQAITNLVDDETIENEIASFSEEEQTRMYFLMKDILEDELRFVINIEKLRKKPGMTLQ